MSLQALSVWQYPSLVSTTVHTIRSLRQYHSTRHQHLPLSHIAARSVPFLHTHRKLLLAESVNEEQILEQAFAFFDRDGNKQVSLAELTTVMTELGDLLTQEELATFVSIMDKNADGVVGVSHEVQGLTWHHLAAAAASVRCLSRCALHSP